MTRIASILLLGFAMLWLTGSAQADKPLSKGANERAAKKACATGDYVTGVDLLADLYVDTNDPLWVYNQGRCYQQNSRWEQAISRFREYLRKAKDISESDRAETERQIADCELSMDKTSKSVALPVAPTSTAADARADANPRATEPTGSTVSSAPRVSRLDRDSGRALRVAGIISAAVGVAAAGAGVALALKANSLSTKDYSRSREDDRASLKTWSFVGYGVGAGTILTGIALYMVGRPSEQSSSLALLPVVDSDGASVWLNGRF